MWSLDAYIIIFVRLPYITDDGDGVEVGKHYSTGSSTSDAQTDWLFHFHVFPRVVPRSRSIVDICEVLRWVRC